MSANGKIPCRRDWLVRSRARWRILAKQLLHNTIMADQVTEPVAPASDTQTEQQMKAEMLADEDPLLISQSLTYVTDDGGILHSFHSAPFSTGECCVDHHCPFRCFFMLVPALS
jgi:hypothetical protein